MDIATHDRSAEASRQRGAAKQHLRDRVMHTIDKDSAVPAFSASAQKLLELVAAEDVEMSTVAEVVGTDPGLTAKFLRLANSSYYGGKSITSVETALLRIGMTEVRKMASTVAALQGAACFSDQNAVTSVTPHMQIEWNLFWLHSLFTARLCESVANAFRPAGGKEYLAGLLHDIGKIFMQRHFPEEFEMALQRSIERRAGLYEAEKQLHDVTHAEVGWYLVEKWKLHREICRSIRFHHEPNSPFNKDPIDPENQFFLAASLCVADALANLCGANILDAANFEKIEFEQLPGWQVLQSFRPRAEFDLDVARELERTYEMMRALGMEIMPPASDAQSSAATDQPAPAEPLPAADSPSAPDPASAAEPPPAAETPAVTDPPAVAEEPTTTDSPSPADPIPAVEPLPAAETPAVTDPPAVAEEPTATEQPSSPVQPPDPSAEPRQPDDAKDRETENRQPSAA